MTKGICQTWLCEEPSKYYNERSSFKYCQKHFDKLGGKIIFDSRSKPPDIIRLKKLKVMA